MLILKNYFKKLPIFAIIVMLLNLIGCDNTPTEFISYNREPVLHSFIILGEPIEEIWIERVSPLLDPYSFYNRSIPKIESSKIYITRTLPHETNSIDTLYFKEDVLSGRYIPAYGDDQETWIGESFVTYRIDVTTPSDEHLWAESLMPGPIEGFLVVLIDDSTQTVVDTVHDGDVMNRTMHNMYITWSKADSSHGFQGKIKCLEPRERLIPLDPDWDPNDEDDKIEENDKGRVGWGTFRWDVKIFTMPWIFFQWAGATYVELYALPQSYYDYLYTYQRNQQGLGVNIDYNIEGSGFGVFAAVSRKRIKIILTKVNSVN